MTGIIGAVGEEVVKLIACMDADQITVKAGMEFHTGRICGTEVTVVQSGIGKVNMAMCAQILIDVFGADTLINTGVAGALAEGLETGDVVIGTDAVQHDMDCTGCGDPLGQVPRMDIWAFPTDRALNERAQELNRQVNPDIHTYMGRIVSGDQFISDGAKKEALIRDFKGSCCEMEGAAMAQTAYRNGVPCLILRAISDNADGSAAVAYETFLGAAVDNLVRLLIALLPQI